ncbi:PREDICTED: uncharacterized protein LOC105560120 [Vollenhovia emeryi]|uniref:uncharacterized protein LOC105560120 n=1 Tax=Vollenhovia emeryi TaxID=411798 RepID=UPI0005F404AE|nr:PREDICTED: uncharacterized protein LOC105560120 [Vollenhovia emeryi]
MKSAIALCLLAVICTADATFIEILLRQIRNTVQSVESTIKELERTHDDTEQNVKLTVMKKWIQKMDAYSKYADPILETIRKEVEEAKAKGKDAQPCYDAAHNILKSNDYNAMYYARQCQECAGNAIKDNLSFIDNLIATGRELIEKLKKIFPDCYEQHSSLWDIIKLHSCINNQLGISKVSVKNLKTDASSAKSTANSASNVVLQQATACLNDVYSTAHSEVAEARSAATRCLNNLGNAV